MADPSLKDQANNYNGALLPTSGPAVTNFIDAGSNLQPIVNLGLKNAGFSNPQANPWSAWMLNSLGNKNALDYLTGLFGTQGTGPEAQLNFLNQGLGGLTGASGGNTGDPNAMAMFGGLDPFSSGSVGTAIKGYLTGEGPGGQGSLHLALSNQTPSAIMNTISGIMNTFGDAMGSLDKTIVASNLLDMQTKWLATYGNSASPSVSFGDYLKENVANWALKWWNFATGQSSTPPSGSTTPGVAGPNAAAQPNSTGSAAGGTNR